MLSARDTCSSVCPADIRALWSARPAARNPLSSMNVPIPPVSSSPYRYQFRGTQLNLPTSGAPAGAAVDAPMAPYYAASVQDPAPPRSTPRGDISVREDISHPGLSLIHISEPTRPY